jgi:hypothetical protein
MALKYIDTSDIQEIFNVIVGGARNVLQLELNNNRITKSEYGDTIKHILGQFISEVPRLYSLEFDIELKKAQIDTEKERLKLLKEQLKLEKERIKTEQLQHKFVRRQIKSFDDKMLIEMLKMEINSWGSMLSSGLLDIKQDQSTGEVIGTIPDFLKNSEVNKIVNKLWENINGS